LALAEVMVSAESLKPTDTMNVQPSAIRFSRFGA
jgi:hypothetical protein